MKRKLFKRLFLGLLILLVLIQFIRPEKNNGMADSDKDITHFVQVPDTIKTLLKISCYDCHSNHTEYPWYSEISPGNWWLANHIQEGKADLNFSDFAQYSPRRMKNKFKAIADQVEKREMPLKSYLLLHSVARLSDGQIQLIKNWTDSARAEVDRRK